MKEKKTPLHGKKARLIQVNTMILLRDKFYDLFFPYQLSINHISVSKDFSTAKLYVSFLYDKIEEREQMISALNSHVPMLKKLLASRLRNSLKRLPNLKFFFDDLLEEQKKMEQLFNENQKK